MEFACKACGLVKPRELFRWYSLGRREYVCLECKPIQRRK